MQRPAIRAATARRRGSDAALKLADLRPGWRTDFFLHRRGAVVIEREDAIVVRTPANPGFYWGNCLVLPQGPADGDLAHWLRRFDDEIVRLQPASRHVAIGVNTPATEAVLPSWRAAGFERHVTAVMRLAPGELLVPAKPPPRGDVSVRPIRFPDDVPAIVELECADTHGFDLDAYRSYRLRQFERYAAMHADGELNWFGVWCDGQLAADCGLMREAARPGAVARFQRVATHPQWRRRGLCSALVHAVSAFGFERWGVGEIFMVANPDDVAIGIYRSLGYRAIETEWCLQRNAPEDRQAA